MNLFFDAWTYFLKRQDLIFSVLQEHVILVLWATFFTVIIGVHLGIAISRTDKIKDIILGAASILYTIPILAFYRLFLPEFEQRWL